VRRCAGSIRPCRSVSAEDDRDAQRDHLEHRAPHAGTRHRATIDALAFDHEKRGVEVSSQARDVAPEPSVPNGAMQVTNRLSLDGDTCATM
jgi:hypothetical protein